MRKFLFVLCLCSIVNTGLKAQCDTPGEIYLLETFVETANGVYLYIEDAPESGTFSFDSNLGALTSIDEYTFGMDVNPVTGTWYIAGSPDGDRNNRHLYTYDPVTGALSASLGQVTSSSGSTNLQAMTFDGSGNLWGSFALGMGVSTVEMISLMTLTGTASTIMFGNGAEDGLGATGMTWDFENNRILISGTNIANELSLYAIDPGTEIVTPLFSGISGIDCSGDGSRLQGMDYAGNNQLISTATWNCDEFILFDIATQSITVLGNPLANDGQSAGGDFKDLVYIPCLDPVVSVPTMGQWGLMCLSLLVFILGVSAIKQRKLMPTRG